MEKILRTVPKHGDKSEDVKKLQDALREAGYDPGKSDGIFGDKTKAQLSAYQKSKGLPGSGVLPSSGGVTLEYLGLTVEKEPASEAPTRLKPATPWMDEAKKDSGQKETNPAFNKKMTAKWSLFGLKLPNITQSWTAWCGLFVAVSLSGAGMLHSKSGASARGWDSYGQAIEWKENGFPRGSIIRINHKGDCKSSANNHVTFADGDCSAEDLLKKGASFNGFGGNQSNQVKVSGFPVAHICAVRWPVQDTLGNKYPMPGKVSVSKNCSGKQNSGESTR